MSRIVRTFSHVRPNQNIQPPRKQRLRQNPGRDYHGDYEYNRSLIESSLDPLVTIGADGKITDVNAATEKVTGCPRQELIGADFSDFFTEPERARAGYQQVFRDGMVQDYPLAIRHRQGRVIPVLYNASVFRDRKGEVVGVFAAARDITERLRLEDELKAISGYTRSLIEASLDPLVTISPQGRITDVNKATELVTGKTRVELIGTNFSDYFTEPEKAQEGYLKVFSEGQVIDYPLTIQDLSGRQTDVLYNASLYQNEKGEVQGVFAAARDITESKRAEKAMRQLAAIVESAEDAVISETMEGTVLTWNPAAERLYGYSAGEIVGKSVYSLVPEERRVELTDIMKRISSGEHVQHYETVRQRKDGRLMPVSFTVSAIKNNSGQVMGISTVARDITERKLAEEQIRKLNAELEQMVVERTAQLSDLLELNRKIIDASSIGIFACREDGPCMIANPAIARIIGSTVEQVLSINFRELDRLKKNGLFQKIETALSSRVEQKGETYLTTTFGKYLWISYYITTFQSMGKLHFLMMVEDISERKQAEAELNRYREHLEELVKERTQELASAVTNLERSNQDLEQFAYVASHDLQEPLRMISSYTQLLARRYKGKLDQDADDFIGYTVDGASRMQQLINDLLAFSRVGTRGKPLEPISSQAALDLALENLQTAIEESHAQVTQDTLPGVLADDLQLMQLFQNLIGNAIKFQGDKPPCIHIGVEDAEKEWVFTVQDNGIGIDPQYFERIFIIFQRLNKRDQFPGTGIGLAICKKIVQRHGGRIWADSKPGLGSTFYFTLPKTGD